MSSSGLNPLHLLPEGANLGTQPLQQALVVSDPFADLGRKRSWLSGSIMVSDNPGTFPSQEPISATGQVIPRRPQPASSVPASSMTIAPARRGRRALPV